MAELFEVERSVITKHIGNIFKEGELMEKAVCASFAHTAADYNQDYRETLEFFARVQNKVHFAITGNTAPEIIHARADSQKNNMGLTSWEGSPNRRITRTDVIVAKNYLNQGELDDLRYIVIAFLDYAEHETKSSRLILKLLLNMQNIVNAFVLWNSRNGNRNICLILKNLKK
jgi:hypothetical protein